MEKHCTSCREAFQITADDQVMLKRLSPIVGGITLSIPLPTHCPECRQRRRLSFRNDKHYYKNTCSSCKKHVISIYSPDKGVPVLCHECFWADSFDPRVYGQDLDLKRPIMDQIAELKKRVPRLCIFNTQSENSEYTVHSSRNKNCYMSSSTMRSEDVHYSDWAIDCKDSINLVNSSNMELCADCNDSRRCYASEDLDLCSNCSDCTLCFDCHASQYLIGCVSRKNQKAMILNVPATKDEVIATRKRYMADAIFRADFLEKFRALSLSCPKRCTWNLNAEHSSGDYLQNTVNAQTCFSSMDLEDCMYVYDTIDMQNCMDTTRGSFSRNLYECKATSDLKDTCFSNLTYQCDNLLYCDNAHGSSECFACFGIKKMKYCILNKQYSKDEYQTLVPTIVRAMEGRGEWGEFFPTTISSFAYNETKAFEAWPLTKDESLARGWGWKDNDAVPQSLQMISAEALPQNIDDVPDQILETIIASEGSKKPYRIIPQELAFYRKRGLPLPRLHPHDRLEAIYTRENARVLYARTCATCAKAIQTTYAPERPETVLCEECYLKEVY